MTDNTFTERYVDAAMRTVPEKQRTDLGAELRTSIEDSIDARVEAGEPADAAERAVLTELGDPDKLAARYTDRVLYLVGPRYYLDWWRLLKLLLTIVLPIAAAGVALGQWLSGATFGAVIGSTVVAALWIAVHMGFWVTLVFAILERTPDTRKNGPLVPWTLDRLPESRPSGLGVVDCVASIVMLALLAGAVIWDQLIGFVQFEGGPLPILSPALWPWWIAALIGMLGVEAVFEFVLFRTRRWTPVLAIVHAAIALAIAVPALVLLVRGELVNEAFFATVIPSDSAAEVFRVVTVITGFAIVVIAGWNVVDGVLKTRRTARAGATGRQRAS